jgi:hypothetical protein
VKFTSASQVLTLVTNLRDADAPRAANRARINLVFNGNPPYTDSQAQEGNIDTNYNFLQGSRIAADARGKLYSAMFGDDTLFTVSVKEGQPEQRGMWGQTITEGLNSIIRRKLVYIEEQRQKWAALVLHGVAPMTWDHPDRWYPCFNSLEDTKFPGRTLVSLRNMEYFAIFRRYTPSQLAEKLETNTNGWNMPLAKELIQSTMKRGTQTASDGDYTWKPELWEQDVKANSGYWGSDIVATIDTWELYYLDDGKVHLKVIAVQPGSEGVLEFAKGSEGFDSKAFLFESKTPWADNFSKVLCLHVTDGNTVPPFRVDTVRSLGYLLYGLLNLDNMTRSKLWDAVFEGLLTYYKNTGGNPEALPGFKLQNYGMIPQGFEVVNASERYQVNTPLVSGSLTDLRRMMGEFSAAFTEDLSNASNPNETATAIIARTNAAQALLTGMLTMAFIYQQQEYTEICRRFCKKNSTDEDVKEFQEEMKEKGVPEEYLKLDCWSIRVNKPIGGGNKTMAMMKVDRLMSQRGAFDEEAQRIILRAFARENTDDPELAAALVKPGGELVTPAAQLASFAMGSLMQGLPVVVPEETAHGEFTFALLNLAKVITDRIDASGGMATKQEVIGLDSVLKEVSEQIQIIAKDPTKKQAVKILSDLAGQLSNLVKGYAQRLSEQGGEGQIDPQVAAAIKKAEIEGQSKAQINAMVAKSKEDRKDEAFYREQQRRNAKTANDLRVSNAKTAQQLQADAVKAQADIAMDDAKTAAEITRTDFMRPQ